MRDMCIYRIYRNLSNKKICNIHFLVLNFRKKLIVRCKKLIFIKKWENVAEYVLNSVEGWKITGKRIRAGAQEIDLSVANISLDDELWQMGAYILIECKNWKKHVGIQQIRNIAHISSMKGNKTAILFTANGITSDSQEEIQRLAMTNIYIICITAVELKQLQSAVECKKLILDKWKSLQDSIEVSGII